MTCKFCSKMRKLYQLYFIRRFTTYESTIMREEQERKYPEYTWDLTTIFKDDEAFEAAFKEVENELGKEEQFKGHIGDSAETLYNALELEDTLGTKLEKVYVYAHLKQDQDTTNDKYTGMESRAHQLIIKFSWHGVS